MTSNTTNLGVSTPLPEGGKSLRIPIERTSYSRLRLLRLPLMSNVDMASFVNRGRVQSICGADLIESLLPDGERDGANGCHP
jgi:hypothetical protein